ncbi:hypothetical protein B9G55_10115 [Saccharibacillus sp. O16]|nr:hypothetical protein B9G55_10115 [Saccharibacillus sp. O16]
MEILWLGPSNDTVKQSMKDVYGDTVTFHTEKIDRMSKVIEDKDFIISFGYRHLITPDVIELFSHRIINIHISYLPWNRGADPNFWSIAEDTRKGVTIHYIDSGLDTGDILVQEEVHFEEEDTLKTSYFKLNKTAIDLLFKHWLEIRNGKMTAYPQDKNSGSLHYKKDLEEYKHILEKEGWETPLRKIKGIARKSS